MARTPGPRGGPLVAQITRRPGRNFRRHVLGYDRREVDAFIEQTVAALESPETVAASSDPLNRIGAEVASLLRTFAESVASMHDEAEQEAAAVVARAEAEAARVTTHAAEFAAATSERAAAHERRAAEELRGAEIAAASMLVKAEQAAAALRDRQAGELQARYEAVARDHAVTELQLRRAASLFADTLAALGDAGTFLAEQTSGASKESPPTVDLGDSEGSRTHELARWGDKS